jgi:hypothetical protein
MEFLEKKIYVSPAPRKYLWLVGNQLPHLQTTDQKNRENPTTQSNMCVYLLLLWRVCVLVYHSLFLLKYGSLGENIFRGVWNKAQALVSRTSK